VFKHLCAYRITSPWTLTADDLARQLEAQAFQPCGQLDMESSGWTAPIEGGSLVHAVNRQLLLQLTTEAKILPASVINQHTKVRAAELEEQQGFKPGRKQMKEIKEIKEQVTDELLPRALCKRTNLRIWIDPVNGWLVIDTSAANRADFVFKMLLKSLESLPFSAMRTDRSPMSAMTSWLETDEAPGEFTIDRDAELRAVADQSKGKLKYTNLTIEAEDIRRRIAMGMKCVQLAMTYADRISFVLTEGLILKRIHLLDILKEDAAKLVESEAGSVERFDADFMIMADEGNKLLTAVVEALGGIEQERKAA
jgi:recombination associated protein RdgC